MLKEIIKTCHSPESVNEPGMVYEVWSDGEITLTKSGDLYGARNLHCVSPGLVSKEEASWINDYFPGSPSHQGYCSMPVMDMENAQIVREAIFKAVQLANNL